MIVSHLQRLALPYRGVCHSQVVLSPLWSSKYNKAGLVIVADLGPCVDYKLIVGYVSVRVNVFRVRVELRSFGF